MARYRATIKGQRGEASRLGSTSHPPVVTINGGECGVRVVAVSSDADGITQDTFKIYATGGSNSRYGEYSDRLIGIIREPDPRTDQTRPTWHASC